MTVMNIKRGTNAFSKADQSSGIKNEPVHTASASDMQAAYGDQNVGDVLNKIADPNWVDPSKKVRTTGDPSLGKDAFMKLMLTQMKYQDPTSPLQSHEMAAQLAQFSSLEQLSNIHGTLESMKTQASPSMNYQALALIGKRVAGDSSKLTRGAGDTKHGVGFELVGDAQKVTVHVKDATGTPIRKLEFGVMKKGQNSIEWNGLKDDGTAARPGEYKISVEGVSSAGKKIYAKTTFGGKITGLNFTAEGPVLMVGNKSIKLSDVKKIEDARDDGPDSVPAGLPALPLKSGDTGKGATKSGEAVGKAAQSASLTAALAPQFMKLQNQPVPSPVSKLASQNNGPEESIPAAEDDPNPGNIGSIPMSRELMAQLEKQI